MKEAGIIVEPTEPNESEDDNEGTINEDPGSDDSAEPSVDIPDNATSADPAGTTDEPSGENPTEHAEEGDPSNE